MSERVPKPEEFTVSMPEGGWLTDLSGKAAEIEQACLDYLNGRKVRPGVSMHPDTYRYFVPLLFDYHEQLGAWKPRPTVRTPANHPRETVAFFDDHNHAKAASRMQ